MQKLGYGPNQRLTLEVSTRNNPAVPPAGQSTEFIDPRGSHLSTDVSMMGVFNNLVMYKRDEPKNSVQSIAPDLASGWSWSEDETPTDLPAARVSAMGHPSPPQKRAFAGVRIEPCSAIRR